MCKILSAHSLIGEQRFEGPETEVRFFLGTSGEVGLVRFNLRYLEYRDTGLNPVLPTKGAVPEWFNGAVLKTVGLSLARSNRVGAVGIGYHSIMVFDTRMASSHRRL